MPAIAGKRRSSFRARVRATCTGMYLNHGKKNRQNHGGFLKKMRKITAFNLLHNMHSKSYCSTV